ncbi:hypothetical protein EI94DRAFT_1252731 [Lactarius quietus]|nr:hypothetical protein EI94DRAFT_1252731 [Lactarius quietus]
MVFYQRISKLHEQSKSGSVALRIQSRKGYSIHLVQCLRQHVLQFSTEFHPFRGWHAEAGITARVQVILESP